MTWHRTKGFVALIWGNTMLGFNTGRTRYGATWYGVILANKTFVLGINANRTGLQVDFVCPRWTNPHSIHVP